MSEIDENRRTSFGAVAELYHRIRPGYPEALMRDLAAHSAIGRNSRILEIGAGTGKATLALASLGAELLALEPDFEMARVLDSNLAGFANVTIARQKFEDWVYTPPPFDVVAAAQAFHWLQKDSAFRKVRSALKPGGTCCLFWNSSYFGNWNQEIRREFDDIYTQYFPQTAPAPERESIAVQVDKKLTEIKDSGLFEKATAKTYPWKQWYSTEQYIDLLDTYSENRVLEDSVRQRFFAEIRAVLERNGGGLEMPADTLLFLATTSS